MDRMLNTIRERLVDAYQPLAIYLFGSRAWGTPDVESDFDLLIVLSDSKETPYERPFHGHRALRGLGISKDILVYTQKEFEKSIHPASLCHRIKHEGMKLYEAP